MASNDSSTGGYLAPLSTTSPTEDTSFEDQLTAIVVGITGLDGTLVRPRWQPDDPIQPPRNANWCAVGIVSITPDANAVTLHRSEPIVAYNPFGQAYPLLVGHDEMQRHEVVEIMASFYGPLSYNYASILRDGFSQAQNREAMTAEGMGFINSDNVVSMPELINQQWLRRADITFRIRRIVIRTYPVLDIVSSEGALVSDQPVVDECAPQNTTYFHVEP